MEMKTLLAPLTIINTALNTAIIYFITQRKYKFDVVNALSVRFENIMYKIANTKSDKVIRHAIRIYFFLCEEEMFYIKNKNIPHQIAKVWIYAMIDLLPNVHKKEKKSILRYLSNEKSRNKLELKKLLKNCPKIREIIYYSPIAELEYKNISNKIMSTK